MKIKIEILRELIEKKFIEKNVQEDQMKASVDYLIWAEMSWISTQWIVKMFGTEPLQDIVPKYDVKVERETPCSMLYDAGANNNMYVSNLAMKSVIEKAKNVWIAISWVRNTFSSNGAQSYYLQKICEQWLIGIMCSRSPWAIAPFNSISPLFGTNPIAFGFPTSEKPVVFDMACSAITFYGLIIAADKWEKIWDNLAIDSDGNITTDPKKAMNGWILPFDKGYKWSSLGMMVELLSWPLLNSSYCDCETFEEEWGATFIAINPEVLTDIDNFLKKSTDMVQKIRNSKTKNGEEVRLPWDVSREKYLQAEKSWEVEIDEMYLEKLWYKK